MGIIRNINRTIFLPKKIAARHRNNADFCQVMGMEHLNERERHKLLSQHIGFLIAMYDTMEDLSRHSDISTKDLWLRLIYSRLRMNALRHSMSAADVLEIVKKGLEVEWKEASVKDRFLSTCTVLLRMEYGELGFDTGIGSFASSSIIKVVFPIFCKEVPGVSFNAL